MVRFHNYLEIQDGLKPYYYFPLHGLGMADKTNSNCANSLALLSEYCSLTNLGRIKLIQGSRGGRDDDHGGIVRQTIGPDTTVLRSFGRFISTSIESLDGC